MGIRITVTALLVAAAVVVGCAHPQQHRSGSGTIVLRDGSSQRAWLGVQLEDVTSRLKDRKSLSVERGAYVQDVVEESPAEKAGIEPGDVIVKFDGSTIDDSNDLMKAVKKTQPKTEVKVDVMRKTERKTLAVTLGRQHASRSYSYNFNMPSIPRIPAMPRIPGRPFAFHMSMRDDLSGLDVEKLSNQLADYFDVPGGMLVTSVEHGSDADHAGFKAGDIITKVDGHSVRDLDDLVEGINDAKDSTAACEVKRKGSMLTLRMPAGGDDRDDDGDEDDDASSSGSLRMPDRHWDGGVWEDDGASLREKLRGMKDELRQNIREFTRKLAHKLSEL